jgi:hypothetical protein
MAFLPAKKINTNLLEELEMIGVTRSTDLKNLSFGSLCEATVAPQIEDDLDSKVINEHTIERITSLLESRALSERDLNDLLEGLKSKSVPVQFEDASRAMVKAIIHQRDQLDIVERASENFQESSSELDSSLIERINSLLDKGLTDSEIAEIVEGLKELDEPSDVETLAEAEDLVERLLNEKFRMMTIGGKKRKVKVKTGGEASKQRRAGRKYRKSASGKASLRRRKKKMAKGSEQRRMARQTRKARQFGTRKEGLALDLARELRIDESNVSGDEKEVLERINRIFDLLKDEFRDDQGVLDVVSEASHLLYDNLNESDTDFTVVIKPSLRIIARLVQELEGNA